MFSDPIKNLNMLELKENMLVADLGAGSGFYSLLLVKLVPNGKVYAIEAQEDFLISLRNRKKELLLNNLECIRGNVEEIGGTHLADNSVNAVIISNLLFQIEYQDKFLQEVQRILKTKGKVLLIDWEKNFHQMKEGYRFTVSREEAKDLFSKYNFILEKEFDAGGHHYGMVFSLNN